MAGQLDKAKEIAALAATVTVKEIFAGIDIERRAGFRMKGTESDELGERRAGRPNSAAADNRAAKGAVSIFRGPRPRRSFASGGERRRLLPAFPDEDGGWRNFLRAARAREFAKPESARTKAQLGDRRDRHAPASEPCGRAFGGERKVPVGSGPGRGPSGEVWKDRARD
jgi:hypothetical protein